MAAATNLHKAASYARRALGERGAVVLRGGVVELAPAAEVTTDVERFERGDDSAYGGELLPDDRYEQWTLGPRARLSERRLAVLRSEGRWDDVLREDPADEEAHRALMRRHAASGDRLAAARQFRLLRDELSRLGAEPSPGVRDRAIGFINRRVGGAKRAGAAGARDRARDPGSVGDLDGDLDPRRRLPVGLRPGGRTAGRARRCSRRRGASSRGRRC